MSNSQTAKRTRRRKASAKPAGLSLSIIVPVFNELENVPILIEQLNSVVQKMGRTYEIIAVNDGSTDKTGEKLWELAAKQDNLKVVNFVRNFGQTAAMMAGLENATGEILITIDADLQNDPKDIPMLVAKIDEGHDLACGWRRDRKDAAIRRNFVSRVANRLISRISGVNLHDYGCTLKAYRRSVIDGVRLYGEMHRFIPIYASWMGASIVEVPVNHHPRIHGQSKYGLERIVKVLLDLLLVKFMSRHLVRPIHLFGGIGLLLLFFAAVSFLLMLYLKFVEGVSMILTPLPVLTSLCILLGVNTILLGLIAEILMRTYFESRNSPYYLVRDKINFSEPP